MTHASWRRALAWLARWGFAALVGCGAVAAAGVAWGVEPPANIPGFALEAAPVYRLEVGAAVFVTAYIASLALVLALNNRGFTEIGTGGLKAQDISRADRGNGIQDQMEILEALSESLDKLHTEFDQQAKGGG